MCQHSDQSFLNKTLCTYSICMDGKRPTAVKPGAENHGWDRSQTTAAPASPPAPSHSWDPCVRCWSLQRGWSTRSLVGCACPRLYTPRAPAGVPHCCPRAQRGRSEGDSSRLKAVTLGNAQGRAVRKPRAAQQGRSDRSANLPPRQGSRTGRGAGPSSGL